MKIRRFKIALKVKIFDSQGTRIVPVPRSTLTIGSAAHCDVVLDHPSVSPEHVRAWLDAGRIWVQDLGTKSGSALNEVRLPALKPMLLRDMDTLKLGDCESTLGLESVLVRAPMVKAQVQPPAARPATPPAPAPTPAPAAVAKVPEVDPDVERRRGEAQALGRELAALRLQLQMAHLEKSSSQELQQQLNTLREEIRNIQEQKAKWNDTLRKMDEEKQTLRKQVEAQIGQLKLQVVAEAQAAKERESQRHEVWKGECIFELKKLVHALTEQKASAWATRPMSKDMMFEWEADLNAIFRRAILNETAEAPHGLESQFFPRKPATNAAPAPSKAPTQASAPAASAASNTGATSTSTKTRPMPEGSKTGIRVSRGRRRWQIMTLSSFLIVGLLTGAWYGWTHLHNKGTGSFSSQAPIAVSTEPPPARVSPPVVKPPASYAPATGHKYHGTYTDNVLYLENYSRNESDENYRRTWATELHKLSAGWKLDSWAAPTVSAKEEALIQDLSRMRGEMNTQNVKQEIAQMRGREAQFMKDLTHTLKTKSRVDRYLKAKRAFYLKNSSRQTATR